MVKKSENNNIDDYYSKVIKKDSSKEEQKQEEKTKKKRIIKVKKVRKKTTNETKDSSSKTTSKSKIRKKQEPKTAETIAANIEKKLANINKKYQDNKQESQKNTNQEKTTKKSKKKIIQKIEVVKDSSSVDDSVSSNKNFKSKKFSNKNSKKESQTKEKKKKSSLKPYNKWRKYKKIEIEETTFVRSKLTSKKKQEKKLEDIKQNLKAKTWETVVIGEVLTLKELSEKIWVNLVKLIAEFMKNWMMVNINSKIDFDSASIVAEAFDVKLKKDTSDWLAVEDLMTWNIAELLKEDEDAELTMRPPVISIMGHVDHWKTSLLDKIRAIWVNITEGEAGWITQSIWAYQVEKEGKKITFLDTPGHEAFTVMRARWAKATDIAILVVAADEWVKPQTIESINHAKEAWIPIIVAINKMDKQWANPDHVKWQLSENWLTPDDWGGDTPMIPVSAKTGFWIDDLLEMVLLQAEILELKANQNRNAIATVIESHLDSKMWPVATVLVNTGTLKKWDFIVCNESYWKVKILKNFENKNIKMAFPWDPALVVGLDKTVSWWDIIQAVVDSDTAKKKASEYRDIILAKKRNEVSGLEVLMSRIKAWNLKQLKIVLKADSNWSLEALKLALTKLSTPETNVVIIHSWVGDISESDILMASSSKAILVWFSVWVVSSAKKIIEEEKVEYIESKVIYHITEKIEKIVSWMLDPKEEDIELWEAKVGWIFYHSKEFMIVWLILQPENTIENWAKLRVIRKKSKVWEWKIASLKSWVEEVSKLEWPCECWIKFEWNVKLEIWDYLEIYKTIIKK